MSSQKFRAWNGRAYIYGGFSIHATGKVITTPLIHVDGDLIVEQCLPIPGVDIYEGDLIQVDEFLWEILPIGTLTTDGEFGFSCKRKGSKHIYLVDKSIYGGKVVGHIHQNQKLLK